MMNEQANARHTEIERRWGRLAAAVEDAAVEVDAEGQNGNVVRQAFEETRAAVEAEIDRLTARLQTAERRIRSLARLVLRTG